MTPRPTPQQTEERFRLLVESIRDYAIFMLDPSGHVSSWNPGAERMKGYTAEEILGRHFSCFYPAEVQKSGWPEHELRVAAAEGRFEDDGWRVRNDGTRFWAHVVITAMRDRDGELAGFAKVTQDLTQSRKVERLEESEGRMSEFLAMLSHELRNPLAPIRSMIDLFKLKDVQDPQLKLIRDVIDSQVAHLTRVVADLLDVTRIKQGTIAVRPAPIELAAVITQALQAARPLITSKQHALHVSMGDASLRVSGDLVRLTQVFVNLLNNAAAYMAPGGDIWLDVRRDGGLAEISVRDKGRGMSPESLEDLFVPFRRGRPSSGTSDAGLGIGLSLVKRLVELHHGSISAHSEGEGCGSEFVVTLPLLTDTAPLEDEATAAAAACAPPLRVLIVDDNRDFAQSLAMLLQSMGHETTTAYDGLAGLEAARRFRPQVVFLDIGLPKVDGYEVARRLRAQPGARCVLAALTGWGQKDDKQQAEEAGFDYHLVKPIELDMVAKVLDSAGESAAAEIPQKRNV